MSGFNWLHSVDFSGTTHGGFLHLKGILEGENAVKLSYKEVVFSQQNITPRRNSLKSELQLIHCDELKQFEMYKLPTYIPTLLEFGVSSTLYYSNSIWIWI